MSLWPLPESPAAADSLRQLDTTPEQAPAMPAFVTQKELRRSSLFPLADQVLRHRNPTLVGNTSVHFARRPS